MTADEKDILERIKTTISCKDCEYIPKVENAGKIIDNYQIMHNGVKVLHGGYHGDWMAEIIEILKGHHEPQEEKAFYEIIKNIDDGGTMIELGSNWAYYSTWFNNSIKNATNIMIEPTDKKLETGKQNFKINKMKGNFEKGFISDSSMENAVFVDWDGKKYTMNRYCIDDIVEKYNLKKVDVVHSDIQGAELEMLHGSVDSILKNKIKYFVISTHSDHIHNSCIEFLKKYKFNIVCEHSVSESYSADGLIVASFEENININISKKGIR
jgi:FkbM family methyltransferase